MEQEKSMTNVLKKLSAIRITLSAEEQKFLDYLVVTSIVEDEVVAHRMQTKAISMATPEEDEVAAHRMQTKAISMATPEEDEVAAHRMQTKSVTKIIYDAEKSQYKFLRY